MKKTIFTYILMGCIAVGLSLSARDFIGFIMNDPLLFKKPDAEGIEILAKIDVPTNFDDYTFLKECRRHNISAETRILSLRRFWLTNYYLYPTKFYFLRKADSTPEKTRKLIVEYKIDYIGTSGKLGIGLLEADRFVKP